MPELAYLFLPQLCLLLSGKTGGEEFLQAFNRRENLVGAAEHPTVHSFDRKSRDHVNGDSLAVSGRKTRGCAARKRGFLIQHAYQLVGLVFESDYVRRNDPPDDAPEAVQGRSSAMP